MGTASSVMHETATDPNEKYDPSQREPNCWGFGVTETLNRVRSNDKDLTVVRLSGRFFGVDGAKDVFDALSYNHSVTSLDVSQNGMKTDAMLYIGRSIYENNHLLHVNISHNPIGNSGIKSLVEPLHHNNTLVKLELANVGMGTNECEVISEILHYNHSLTELNLSYNGFGKSGASFLGGILPYTFTLFRLNISHNDIGTDGLQHFAKGMLHNRSLKSLDVSENGIETEGVIRFLQILRDGDPPLEVFNIGDNQIEFDGITTLCELLPLCLPHVHTLGLRNIDLDDEGCGAMEEILVDIAEGMQSLDISENNVTLEGMKSIFRILDARPSFKYLDVTANQLGEEGGRLLLEQIKKHLDLVTVYYGSTGISLEVAKQIHEAVIRNRQRADMFLLWEGRKGKEREEIGTPPVKVSEEAVRAGVKKARKSRHLRVPCLRIHGTVAKLVSNGVSAYRLTRLELMCNNFTNEETFLLCAALSKAACCNYLDLTSNYLNSEGGSHVAKMLESVTTLTTLYLGDNNIGDVAATNILNTVAAHPSLRSLSIEWNHLTSAIERALYKALRTTTVLSSLYLCGNHIDNEGVEAICAAIERHCSLSILDISLCEMKDVSAIRLSGVLRHHDSLFVNTYRNPLSRPTQELLVNAVKSRVRDTLIE